MTVVHIDDFEDAATAGTVYTGVHTKGYVSETITVEFNSCTIVVPTTIIEYTFTTVSTTETGMMSQDYANFLVSPATGCPVVKYGFEARSDSDFDPMLTTDTFQNNGDGDNRI